MDRLHSMRTFQKVVDEGGFAAAARAMDLSPAVVTRLVADLEDHLGTRLLHRTTRRVSLTEAGEIYLDRVRQILLDLEEASALVSSQTQELAGVLRVLAPPVLATHVLAPMVAGFRQAYPKIRLDIDVETHREPPVEDYDVTLIGADGSFDANVIARKVISTEGILLASPEYIARRGLPATPEDLAQHDVLRLKPAGGRSRKWRLLNANEKDRAVEIDVQPVLWANHTDTLMHAALDGAGITATSVELAAPLLADGDLVRVLSPWITNRLTLYAALPSRKFVPRRTQVFLDHLTQSTRARVDQALSICVA
ncbi:MAG: LysR family transcriptional regulator [Hydrogenophaga sp.]|uniref:LysR family transcriptional regulator n=1 Tax=Hydrogenophaga crocea TaxID=2716225 RepID=A0A6G8IDE4_9BURK|nr:MULTISPECIES: LysR family transcriptional regulator [Hydrogenophaga]MBL0942778.1 LysR family transcriptional regulator [Hydrogenophaga sp.]QIM51085.1 LysR family transcriptional regulator [Hydrogenophaga crocea]